MLTQHLKRHFLCTSVLRHFLCISVFNWRYRENVMTKRGNLNVIKRGNRNVNPTLEETFSLYLQFKTGDRENVMTKQGNLNVTKRGNRNVNPTGYARYRLCTCLVMQTFLMSAGYFFLLYYYFLKLCTI